MVHKVFVFVHYNKQEYNNYFNAYVDESSKLIEGFLSSEIPQFVRTIIDNIRDYKEGESIDLCVAQDNDADIGISDLKNEFGRFAIVPIDKTLWNDEQIYEILEKIFHSRSEDIIINGIDKNISKISKGTESNTQSETENIESNAATNSANDNNKLPTLAKLMRKLAEKR